MKIGQPKLSERRSQGSGLFVTPIDLQQRHASGVEISDRNQQARKIYENQI
jgi:hypothetical protein